MCIRDRSYQWKKDSSPISGAVNPTYTIASVASSDAASYTCTVSNTAGSVTTAAASLAVNQAPSITTQPVSLTLNPGASASFTVAASGTSPLSYQWKKDSSPISGAVNPTYMSLIDT